MPRVFVEPVRWKKGRLQILDQTQLPGRHVYVTCRRVSDVWRAIKKLKTRGAPLIGIVAAYGFVLGMRQASRVCPASGLAREARRLRDYLSSSRPTAVNLGWALRRMQDVFVRNAGLPVSRRLKALRAEADRIMREDSAMCFRMADHGARLVRFGDSLLTVCNAGGLATSGYGTALGVFYRAKEQGKRIRVYACETRPLLQGARLTTWELRRYNVDTTLICDSMAARLMQLGRIKAVFVGADRVAANGDLANKIGSYMLAVCASYHKIPFYVVAPFSTFDLSLGCGADIPIEEREPAEVTALYFKRPIAARGVAVYNPAFDMVPARLVTAIITEKGVLRPPFKNNIGKMYGTRP